MNPTNTEATETTEAPTLDHLYSIRTDGSRRRIEPADVKGRFVTARRLVYTVLIAVYVLLPFVQIGGHPAMQLDVERRQFFLFGSVFNAQDFWRVVFLLGAAGFSLLFVTAWIGRVWCGWACPQTVFLEGVYRRIERLIEGSREKRIRRDKGPLTLTGVVKTLTKHFLFILVSLLLAHVALSFFVSGRALVDMIHKSPAQHPEAFAWMAVITALLYFNFAWFREQMCIVICPYGRMQSALQDADSIVIGYDIQRGEPRGKLNVIQSGAKQGDCVDCKRCVVVCPTGIDIRLGLQMECIGCAQCIDACDEIMDKVGRPRGLIRYDSSNGLEGKPKRVVRGRLIAYGTLFVAAIAGMTLSLIFRTPFEANLLRLQGAPYVMDQGSVRNQFELHLVNKNPEASTFVITPSAADTHATFIVPQREVRLEPLASIRLPLFVTVSQSDYRGPFAIAIDVADGQSHRLKHVNARFLGPAGRTTATTVQ